MSYWSPIQPKHNRRRKGNKAKCGGAPAAEPAGPDDMPPHYPRVTPEDPRIEVGGISASGLLNDVPHRVCSPSLSPHPPVVVLVRLWKGGRVVRCQGAGALLMPLEVWGAGNWDYLFISLFL
eukprot:scaffold16995_cov127-Isochrysis_galbana.AAC.4